MAYLQKQLDRLGVFEALERARRARWATRSDRRVGNRMGRSRTSPARLGRLVSALSVAVAAATNAPLTAASTFASMRRVRRDRPGTHQPHSELSQLDDGGRGYYVRKVLVGQQCFRPIEVRLRYSDLRATEISREIKWRHRRRVSAGRTDRRNLRSAALRPSGRRAGGGLAASIWTG